jgi:VIT1/CCC1 family predicted Fe2+/Mn2+ transporter
MADENNGGLSPRDQRTKDMVPALAGFSRGLRKRAGGVKRPVSHAEAEESSSGNTGTFRAAIFGVSDGLVSNVSLIMGVAGAGVDNQVILIAGLAGLLAGAFSMGAGEYISMRAQREVFERLIDLERKELQLFPDEERSELADIYQDKGVPPALANDLATAVMANPEVALDTHAREELGLDPEEGLGSPWGASIASFFMFAFGAAVPLVPFIFGEGTTPLVVSAVLSGLVLFVVGAGISVLTGRSALLSGLRQVAVGAAASIVTYAVGSLFNVAVA